MNSSEQFLNPSDAAKRLGVSAKALRLYEQRGLITPIRTAAGWRTYGPKEMARAGEIVALRDLGLGLGQVERVLGGDVLALEPALAAHQAVLEGRVGQIVATVEKIRRLRAGFAEGQAPHRGEQARLLGPADRLRLAFDLPWPWGGERFELSGIGRLTYIAGPLGCGKTRLLQGIAQSLPDAAFLGMERASDGAAQARAKLQSDADLAARVERVRSVVVDDGAAESDALVALLAALEAENPAILVVDMLEHGLDHATQDAVIAYLRRHRPGARPLFFTTRSSAILDLDAVGPDEAIILCPANHSPPSCVAPYPGAPGYESIATCLTSPEVRARTQGVIASQSSAA